MDKPYWHRQLPGDPLFAHIAWSRPENRNQAGKLLIMGGNAHGFAAAAEAYNAALQAGIGTARVLLPDSLQKTVGKVLEAGEYAPSTPSGSFGRQALAEVLAMADWANGLLLAGDFGRNSETAIVLEQLLVKYHGPLAMTKDAPDYFAKAPHALLDRPESLLVLSFAQLQKLAIETRFPRAFTFDMDLLRLVDNLHKFTTTYRPALVVKHLDILLTSFDGQVSTTKLNESKEIWRVRTAATASVWWVQNPGKTFEAVTTAISMDSNDG